MADKVCVPRYRRHIAAGSTQHVISRFVNREFRLDRDGARAEYLRRAARALGRCDWTALAFALMSSHVHWALRAGGQPSAALVKPLHAGFAGWLNAVDSRLGPVFAERHRSLTFEGHTAAALLAYIHNNPVRAGLVSNPVDSPWTSHRAYLGLEPPPPWLDVELGLRACGFDATRSGRAAFHDMVCSRMHEPQSAALGGRGMRAHRRRARARAAAPVEVASPTARCDTDAVRLEVPLVVPPGCDVRPRWDGEVSRVLRAVQSATGVHVVQLRSRDRRRRVSRARRLALLVWTQELRRAALQMAQSLGISSSSAAYLTSTASADDRLEAAALGRNIWDQDEDG